MHEGVSIAESVPFLYRQYKSAIMIGKPQPLKIFEQNIPSFEPSTSNAIRIQRVELPVKQQFIKNLPCVRRRGYVIDFIGNTCGSYSFYYIIFHFLCFCVKKYVVKTKKQKIFPFILLR